MKLVLLVVLTIIGIVSVGCQELGFGRGNQEQREHINRQEESIEEREAQIAELREIRRNLETEATLTRTSIPRSSIFISLISIFPHVFSCFAAFVFGEGVIDFQISCHKRYKFHDLGTNVTQTTRRGLMGTND